MNKILIGLLVGACGTAVTLAETVPGLRMEYFKGTGFTEKVLEHRVTELAWDGWLPPELARLDHTDRFNPNRWIPFEEGFSLRWSGQLKVATAGTYYFENSITPGHPQNSTMTVLIGDKRVTLAESVSRKQGWVWRAKEAVTLPAGDVPITVELASKSIKLPGVVMTLCWQREGTEAPTRIAPALWTVESWPGMLTGVPVARPGVAGVAVTRRTGRYAGVRLDFACPQHPIREWRQWTYMGGMRDGKMILDDLIGLRNPGGELTLKGDTLSGAFRYNVNAMGVYGFFRGTQTIRVTATVKDGAIEGTMTIGDVPGTVRGMLVPEEELARNNALPADKGWPMFLGPIGGGMSAQPTGVKLIENPESIRLRWRCEEIDIGQGPGSITRFQGAPANALGRRTGSGGAGAVVDNGRVFFSYFVPTSGKREQTWGRTVNVEEEEKDRAYILTEGNKVDPQRPTPPLLPGVTEPSQVPEMAAEKIYRLSDDVVLCMDGATGKTIWKAVMPGRGVNLQHHKAGPFNMTMGVKDGVAYALGMSGWLYAFKADDGTPLWEVDLLMLPAGQDQDPKGWGNNLLSAAVIVAKGAVIAPWYGRWSGFDPATGRQLWILSQGARHAASPIWSHKGKDYLIFGTGAPNGGLVCVDVLTGEELWEQPFPNAPAAIGSGGRGLGPGGVVVYGDTAVAYVIEKADQREEEKRVNVVQAWNLSLAGATLRWSVPRIGGDPVRAGGNTATSHLPVVVGGRHVVIGDMQVIDLATGKVTGRGEGPRPMNGGFLQAMEDVLMARVDGTHGGIQAGWYRVDKDGNIRLLGDQWQPPVGSSTTSYHHPIHYPMVDGRVFMRQLDGIYCWDLRAEAK